MHVEESVMMEEEIIEEELTEQDPLPDVDVASNVKQGDTVDIKIEYQPII